jgi:hypothetical protein
MDLGRVGLDPVLFFGSAFSSLDPVLFFRSAFSSLDPHVVLWYRKVSVLV